jgi:hypothetical protein
MDEPERKFVSNEEAQATTRMVATVLLAIGFVIAYWVWPAGITDLPLAAVTFGALLRAIASGVMALVTLYLVALFWF